MMPRTLNVFNLAKWLPLPLLLALSAEAQTYFSTNYPTANGTLYYTVSSIARVDSYVGTDTTVSIPSAINVSGSDVPVTIIGVDAFAGEPSSLTSVILPDSVTLIGQDAFGSSGGLTTIALGDGVITIGNAAFDGCTNLTSITLPASLTSIGDGAFDSCSSLTSIAIPDNVTNIGTEAFIYCTGLTNVTIGQGLTNIGYGVFDSCRSLTSVTIPANVTSIGDYAFAVSGLHSITIPANVTRIGTGVFADCTGMTNATIVTGVNSIGGFAFDSCTNLVGVTIPGSVTAIGGAAFYNCTKLTSVAIPDSVVSLGEDAFDSCRGLANVIIGTSVTNIADFTFYDCIKLTTVNIPASVTSIGDDAFDSCASLPRVTIGNGVTRIGEDAFVSCDSLTNITVGTNVVSIGSYAFSYCPSLTAVYFLGNSPTPTNDLTVFESDTTGTVYYVSGTTGWGAVFDGWPTMAIIASDAVGSVTSIVGEPKLVHNGTTNLLHQGDSVEMGDIVETDAGATVDLVFKDNGTLQVAHNAELEINEYVYDANPNADKSTFSLFRGALNYTSGLIGHEDPDAEHIHTAAGVIGIRGTQFIVQPGRCSSTDIVYLIQGQLAITPVNTPGVTNICDAPVTISITPANVITNALDQAMYNSISNQLFQETGVVTFPSWLEQYFNCTNDPAAAPTADPDGDGQDNYTEFLAGTVPTSSASFLHILAVTPEANDVIVSWTGGADRTNVLQATTNLSGSWSNVSPNIVLTGSGDSITNYVDAVAITNAPARFYRVKLVQ